MFFSSRKKNTESASRQGSTSRSGRAFGIDLGTANIKIYNSQSDRIAVRKNMIALENRKDMIAYGDDAFDMFEKSPSYIRAYHPIGYGVIADIGSMELLLAAFMKDQQRGVLHPADYYIAMPTDVTEVERRAFYDLVADAGVRARHIFGVEKAVADALGLGIDVKNSQGIMIVDVGYDTTEVSILSMGGIVLSRLLKTGGHVFDQAIVQAVRREFALVIGEKSAERVRLAFNDAALPPDSCDVYGRDLVTGLPMKKTLSRRFVSGALEEYFRAIAEQARIILERTPPELSADIYRRGLFVTGGASQEEGLISLMQEEISLEINLAREPLQSAALGLAKIIRQEQYQSLAYTIEGLAE